MPDEPLIETRSGDVVVLTLNRPEVRNAMTAELTEAFAGAVATVRGDSSVRAVVVTGAGRAFCSGGDLSFIQPGPDASVSEIRSKMRAFYPKFLAIRDLDVPTIAAINGAAIGAGLCLAMACDLRIASLDATLGTTFVRLGMHPGMAATYLLTRLVGTARAAELFFTGKSIGAEEAERIGLVNKTTSSERLLADALELAGEIAANAPLPMGMVKRAIYLAERADLDAMLEYEGLAQPITMATRDMREGLDAIKEKRPPAFRGE